MARAERVASRNLLVRQDGTWCEVVCPQREVAARLGGPVTFVGMLDANHVVVALAAPGAHVPENMALRGSGALFEASPPVRGDAYVCASDVAGEETDADAEALALRLGLGPGAKCAAAR